MNPTGQLGPIKEFLHRLCAWDRNAVAVMPKKVMDFMLQVTPEVAPRTKGNV